jgi:hypothetical protein
VLPETADKALIAFVVKEIETLEASGAFKY